MSVDRDGVPSLLGDVGSPGVERIRLLDAALLTVARRGYVDATCDEGVRVAGLSLDAARQHFGGKLECFLAAYDAATGALLEGARRVGHAHVDWPGRVHSVIGFLLERLAVYPDVAMACIVELPAAGSEGLARQDRALERLAGLLRPPPRRAGAIGVPVSVVDQLLAGGVWEAIRTVLEQDGPEGLPVLRPDLAGWVLGLGGGGARLTEGADS